VLRVQKNRNAVCHECEIDKSTEFLMISRHMLLLRPSKVSRLSVPLNWAQANLVSKMKVLRLESNLYITLPRDLRLIG
jgi:hypothetical protein